MIKKCLDNSRYVTNWRKYTTFLKPCFDSSTVIFSTKLNVKCKTKCSLDKTNNRTEHWKQLKESLSTFSYSFETFLVTVHSNCLFLLFLLFVFDFLWSELKMRGELSKHVFKKCRIFSSIYDRKSISASWLCRQKFVDRNTSRSHLMMRSRKRSLKNWLAQLIHFEPRSDFIYLRDWCPCTGFPSSNID